MTERPENKLEDAIRARIAQTGPISVEDYMAICLADQQSGYYATRDPFGGSGDFTTAPEISQIFGELLGLWTAEVWHGLGRPAPFRLIELGPGRGTLMADAVRALKAAAPDCLAAADLHLVETSPTLRAVPDPAPFRRSSSISTIANRNSTQAVNSVAITAAGRLAGPNTRRQSGMPMKPTLL